MTNQDNVWRILDDVLVLLAGQHYPTPGRTYKLDGGWSLALADLKACFADLRAKLAAVEAERDAARAGEARAVEALRAVVAAVLPHEEDTWIMGGVALRHVHRVLDQYEPTLDNQPSALDWLAQQRREAAVEALEEFAYDADGIEELITCNIFDLRSALRARAAALRAGEVGDE